MLVLATTPRLPYNWLCCVGLLGDEVQKHLGEIQVDIDLPGLSQWRKQLRLSYLCGQSSYKKRRDSPETCGNLDLGTGLH